MYIQDSLQSKLGSFKASLIPKSAFWISFSSIILCYIISVHLGQEPPFPHCWISGTAGHYPAFIIFRIGTISGSTLLILSWLINHFWIKTVSLDSHFKIGKYAPSVTLILGIMGAIGLMGSTANIDTGKRNEHWHTTCASIFFIFTGLATTYNTIIAAIMYRARIVSRLGFLFKLILTISFFVQLYISQTYGNAWFISSGSLGNDIDHIIEYTAAFTILFYVYVMGIDIKKYRLVYEVMH